MYPKTQKPPCNSIKKKLQYNNEREIRRLKLNWDNWAAISHFHFKLFQYYYFEILHQNLYIPLKNKISGKLILHLFWK